MNDALRLALVKFYGIHRPAELSPQRLRILIRHLPSDAR